ncbi:biogenesis of lysosome-related organelles complex 1 subunit 1 isoform X1 [Canis lupus baileyi]|uniref:biogenesis of lysosome-related organelles complex 1 subunit 1 isoform X1 n=1 Tax=Canis lupus baileyi TaxID=143281 RepID=UPI003B978B28
MLSRLLREHQAKQSERKELQEKRRREAIAAATCLTEALVDHLNVGLLAALPPLQWNISPGDHSPPAGNRGCGELGSEHRAGHAHHCHRTGICVQRAAAVRPLLAPLPFPPPRPSYLGEADRPRIKHKPPFLCGVFQSSARPAG